MIDDAERTYVGHPVEALIAAVGEVVRLRDPVKAVFCCAAGSGQLPHRIERLPVDR